MKLPSLASLWEEIMVVFRRFPLQVLVTIIAVAVCILKIENPDLNYLNKLLACCNFALTLLLAADLFAESHSWTAAKQWGLRLAVLLLCGLLYLVLDPTLYEADLFRILLLGFAFHLLVSFAPFIGRGGVAGFWVYNERLFLQLIIASIFSFVLTIGLYIAFASTNALFDLKLSGHVYGYIVSTTMVGFLTIFFLSGVPKDFRELDEVPQEYPKWLKIFTQFVLIPLLSVYLVILLVYEAKILVDWQLPKGYVSTLILCYAVAGILSLLLIHPIRNREGNGWMGIFSRFFYAMMVPLVVLLLLAVWKRVSIYGITEARYILILLALWLSIITVYSLFSKKQNIRLIPISLCILALLAAYGPQSAFSVSRYSQTNRLGKMMKLQTDFARKEKSEIIKYLVNYHGILALQSFTAKDLKPLQERYAQRIDTAQNSYGLKLLQVDTAMVILNVPAYRDKAMVTPTATVTSEGAMLITGYDYYLTLPQFNNVERFQLDGHTVKTVRMKGEKVSVSIGNEVSIIDVSTSLRKIRTALKANKLTLIDGSVSSYKLPENLIDVPFASSSFEGVFRLTHVIIDDADLPSGINFQGCFLLRLKTSK